MDSAGISLEHFMRPLAINLDKVVSLARLLEVTYRGLARESENQFLPTPISDSILRPEPDGKEHGRYLAIDIGGTNLRVGFVELNPSVAETNGDSSILPNGLVKARDGDCILEVSRVRRVLEKNWPIGEQLKNEKAEDLFAWIGECIAEVVEDGVKLFPESLPAELPMGVTFSFPMIQHTLSDATLMSMGKGFAITSNLDLGKQLRDGYAKAISQRDLPKVKILAIVNDAVATFVSFVYQLNADPKRKAAIGLIVGTGNNATIPLKLSSLHLSKRPKLDPVAVVGAEDSKEELKIVVNTEWSINGSAPPLRELNLITRWDTALDLAGEAPGFMPFEYMTSGRYLGELGRLITMEYLTKHLGIAENLLPEKLRARVGLTTTFLGNLGSHKSAFDSKLAVSQLQKELPTLGSWNWTVEAAEAVFVISKYIQFRAAGMTAAAIIGLLACAEEIDTLALEAPKPTVDIGPESIVEELTVGYTGGCIVHFQDYLRDCQDFLNQIMDREYKNKPHLRVVLHPCNDGGIIGAGVLAGAVQARECI